MSKPRRTPVPLPGSKTKTHVALPGSKKTSVPSPASKKAATTQLSQEFVGDSDDSSDKAATKSGAKQQKAPINIAVHKPKTNGVAKTSTEAKKKQKDSPRKAAKESVIPKKKDAVTRKKPVPTQVVVEEEGADSSSEESSDDAETDMKQAQQREAQRKKKEETDSSSDDSSDESDEDAGPAAQQPQARPAQAQTHTVAFQQARPYVPPEDFNPVSTERAALSSNANIFKNLEGKQMWHITAPEGVSLKDLTQLAMDKARNGEAVLDHRGTSYGFVPVETGAGEREVMIPVPNGYKAVPARISQSFQVQQVIDLPNLTSRQVDQDTGSAAAASITASTIRAVKPQVRGLKMRFFPSGFENSAPTTMGVSDSEDDASAPQPTGLAIPKGFDPPAKKEKRKHEQANGEEEMEAPAKKHKKHRTAEEQARRDEKKAKKERKKEKSVS